RYFFLPFALTFWLLIQCFFATRPVGLRAALAAAGALAIANAVPVWSRSHEDLHWSAHALSCPRFADYAIPVHTDVLRPDAINPRIWPVPFKGPDCQRLLEKDRLLAPGRSGSAATYPYTLVYGRHWRGGERENAT